MADDKKKEEDSRLTFLASYIMKNLGMKIEKWNKMISVDDYKVIVMEFFMNPDRKKLIIMNRGGMLIPLQDFPEQNKSKSIYFMRRKPEVITAKNISEVLRFGSLSARPYDDMAIFLKGVIVPLLLQNNQNREDMPPSLRDSLEHHIQDFQNSIAELQGNLVGKTLLPQIINYADIENNITSIIKGDNIPSNEMYKTKTILENLIGTWNTRIENFLNVGPESLFEVDSYPTIMDEFDYWYKRQSNLEFIYDQLKKPEAKTIVEALEILNSDYYQMFKRFFQNVVQALCEVKDIISSLNDTQKFMERVTISEANDFNEMMETLLNHSCLAWSKSKYYCTNEHMSRFFLLIHNYLMQEARKFLNGESVFQGEVEDILNNVKQTIDILSNFKPLYWTYQARLTSFIQPETNPQIWTFDLNFERFNKFMKRLIDIREIYYNCFAFIQLEKVEIGGIKGREIGRIIGLILDEFMAFYTKLGNVNFDPLNIDTDPKDFEKLKEKFYNEVEIFERRIVSQYKLALLDCDNIEKALSLLQIIGQFMKRPIIKENLMENIIEVIQLFHNELDTLKKEFDRGIFNINNADLSTFPIHYRTPAVSGILQYVRQLKNRILSPYKCYKEIGLTFLEDTDDGQYVLEKLESLIKLLDEYENHVYTQWHDHVFSKLYAHLTKSIIIRGENDIVLINFSDELHTTLKDTKNLIALNYKIPEPVQEFYDRQDILWRCRVHIEKIAFCFNYLKGEINDSEKELMKNAMIYLDFSIQAIQNDNWIKINDNLTEKVYLRTKSIYDIFNETRKNLDNALESIREWGRLPLYFRIEKCQLLNLKQREQVLANRYRACLDSAKLIKKVVIQNFFLYLDLPIEESLFGEVDSQVEIEEKSDKESIYLNEYELTHKASQTEKPSEISLLESANNGYFIEYKKHIDQLIFTELANAVETSLKYLHTEIQATKLNNNPLVEIKMELQETEIVFFPSFDIEDLTISSLFGLMKTTIADIFRMADLITRVYQSNPGIIETYQASIKEVSAIKKLEESIISATMVAIEKAKLFYDEYLTYSYFWMQNKKTFLESFVKSGRSLSEFAIHDYMETSSLSVRSDKSLLVRFREQIDKFDNLYNEISNWDIIHLFEGWIVVEEKNFKFSLLNHVAKWSDSLKQYLLDYVTEQLVSLKNFNENACIVLGMELTEKDFEKLLDVMSLMNEIDNKEFEVEEMFLPAMEIIEALKGYQVKIDSEVYKMLEELPEEWKNVKKMKLITKQVITPIQGYQVKLIEKRNSALILKIKLFRDRFEKLPFFKYPCDNVYEIFDKVKTELEKFTKQLEHLTDSSELFELIPPDSRLLQLTTKELYDIKHLWDYVKIIESCVDDWKTTPWSKIDVEAMDQECKKFNKNLRQLDKNVQKLEPFVVTMERLKNLMTSLRAVTELQNPAIQDRHWIELMQATKVRFQMDASTTLADLLDLNLHNYEEEVKNIVDKSVKEMAMEKILSTINSVWAGMEFSYEVHDRTKLKILQPSEEIVELLEEHQVQLQNMLSSKYIDHFKEEVTKWQYLLSNADQIIQMWFNVQRKWMYLESIFIGSEDIRKQLPADSQRFDVIDKDFKALVAVLQTESKVVKVTKRPEFNEKLELLIEKLILCEKALNNYLETKRLAFPRFYFVSSADLLDILANGNKPELVCRHMIKLYDSLKKLEIISATKQASGMYSKENDEFVLFDNMCDCSGKVEDWLNRVTDSMKKTLRKLFQKAVESYEEKSRDKWIFDWPAQPALCGTQIWWTIEVKEAFRSLEKGYENAIKDYQKKQIAQLNLLINLLIGELTAGDRQKIMTICTIDVHSRDVVGKIIQEKIETDSAFQWQSQLRHRWDTQVGDCFANICDAQFQYDYEYLGNTPRLVITPLTDRCYITLTQSLHLIMGGAPAGPAGTGKTETTKDLGRALGIMVYVFNCSEQMDYKSCGNIYKGLAQTGAWGCFDEFNRISVEVLSVVAVQVKSVLDAIKAQKSVFNFMGEIIRLIPTVGMFITMNPGYAGRTELPENLKSLFRPCAMVVPDFALICEIMLVAEGFQEARLLARKFITLYTLCKELLSKQDHYDWGLRAIKSVLVVAGALKRGDPTRPEDQVLMRALRDFNIPKIVTDDFSIFMGLIGDLFPALNVPRKRVPEFEELIKKSAVDLNLQPEDGFILKVVQLEELFAVRHSVFVIGSAGTGKSQVWKTLHQTYHNQKLKPFYNDLNPKAVTNDELFGIINPSTREWKDGLFSVIMRDQTNMGGKGPKWIVLDGDIDPMWIESLNTLMDDNKVLTLASNERISLTKEMRLLFEIADLKTATPATVSRAGILYINAQDVGFSPYISSWIETRENQSEKTILSILFDEYVPTIMEAYKIRFKKITPITDMAMVQMTCYLLDCLLLPNNVPEDCPREWYEIYFVFAVIWGFGSTLFKDQLIDWRNEFHKWWINEFKTVKFPSADTIFHYYIDHETKKFLPWTNIVASYDHDPSLPLQSALVSTVETARIRYFLDLLIEQDHPVMLIGNAGTGKSVIMAEKLNNLSDDFAVTNVPFNFYTTSEMLQKILEKPLEKKAGKNFGPPGGKRMIYFIDDLNMPEVDTYGTVQPHTLIRQFMDYKHWYDRTKLTLKEIHNCQFVASMNPTAGSFTINPRLQRHFCSFSCSSPSQEALYLIYSTILSQHLQMSYNKFSIEVQNCYADIVNVALDLHNRMGATFLPTASKFHYIFNVRDLASIFQGILFSNGACCPTEISLLRLWIHEVSRVYGDKLTSAEDIKIFKGLVNDVIKKGISNLDVDDVYQEPLIYFHYAESLGDPKYLPVPSWEQLDKILKDAQVNYNDMIGLMNLVLFEDAMCHICRISRILEASRGYALLIGVGGSGKQSLTRLTAFISSLNVSQIQLRKGYSINDLKTDLSVIYTKAGLKNTPSCFLMSDAQVAEELFLVLINDMLTSGDIPELFPDDEVENIISAMRNEVKQAGLMETKDNCWKFFIDKVRRSLKVVLCFSPVGSTLRVRARKFPGLVNCTSIDWFHEWPKIALESVSEKFLSSTEYLPKNLIKSVSCFMAYVHETVNQMSKVYFENEKRYNYTTPKTFLELIDLYTKLLGEQNKDFKNRIFRLENGLLKLADCSRQVDALQVTLVEQEAILSEKNKAADKLVAVVTAENEKVKKEQLIASEEEAKVRIIEVDVSAKALVCEEDVQKAQPAIKAAQEALNTLNKNNLTELKSFGTPPDAVVNVTQAVLILFSKGNIPKDRSWKVCKVMMGKADTFLNNLMKYDKEHIHPEIIKALQPYVKDPNFDPEKIMAKSGAAAGLCAWVLNILKYHEVWVYVEPKMRALSAAQTELKDAQTKLEDLNNKLTILEEQMNVIEESLNEAIAEKKQYQDEADRTTFTIELAHKLVNGLASENIRWRESVKIFKEKIETLPGDILLISCFISYLGCFTKPYRVALQNEFWIPTFKKMDPIIPTDENSDPLDIVCDDAIIAQWNNEGLPNDRMSAENAIILTNSGRWPLMIDPQLQGIKWIKQKYENNLIVTRLTAKSYLDVIEKAVVDGSILLIENIDEKIDAVLNPLLSRDLIKKGTYLKMGDNEIPYNKKFRLILHTKLANPHFKPEMQAQTTLINFTVTRDGLEEQLLAEVIKSERPDLESQRTNLTIQQNNFKITIKTLEDDLLQRLSSAGEDVLSDTTLVLNLEKTKKMAEEIEIKVKEAKITAAEINNVRELYRSVAERASILYFILNELSRINPMYQFSLAAFSVVFKKAMMTAIPSEELTERVVNLIENVTFSVFLYTDRGLFERDKLIFLVQIVIQIMSHAKEINYSELDFLLRFSYIPNLQSPFSFLTNVSWGGIKKLSELPNFKNLDNDIENSAKRWTSYVESDCPENEKLPGEWKNKNSLQKLCILRALRPDRMTYALKIFAMQQLGNKFIENRAMPFAESFEESSAKTPIFFILSAGVDPLKDVENLGLKMKFTTDFNNFYNISLGQGQEIVAENAMDVASQQGHWVILQNIHLVAKWLSTLEKKIEATQENAHESYRLFMSAEPASSAEYHILPQGILESAIKITNEPPSGMQANIHKALDNFRQETLEMCTKESEFKAILFSLCYFHSVVGGRSKFGPQGWNRSYPFNFGDLTISVYVLYNYLEANIRVPWEDLRYLFGEIMYGGHITDDWDRRLCRTYLEEYMKPSLIDGELELCPGFLGPRNTDYVSYHNYIDDNLPPESPYLYGLHPNTEIGVQTTLSENIFKTIFELQPRDSSSTGEEAVSKEDTVTAIVDELMDKIHEGFNMAEIMVRVEERTPFIVVAFQECERMNMLMFELRRTLTELHLGIKGELTMTSDMENLQECLFMDHVPAGWTKLAYPSLLGLQSWFADLTARLADLEAWAVDFSLPPTIWLGSFFNPQSFLTAIMQQTARKNEWPLDKMCLNCDVTKKEKEEFLAAPREGAYIHGLFMEGARWDTTLGSIVDSKLKELFPAIPVVFIKAVTKDKQDVKNVYECPLYKIRQRGPTFVWALNLKTRQKPSKWTLAGVCLLLQV